MLIASFTPDDGLPRCSVCGQTEETPQSPDPRVAACPLCGRVLNFAGGAEFPEAAPAEELATSWEGWRYRFARALLTRQSRYHIARELTRFGLRFTPAVAAGVWRLRDGLEAELITHEGADLFSPEHRTGQSELDAAVGLRDAYFPPPNPETMSPEFRRVLMPLQLDEQTLVLELVLPREAAERESRFLINRLRALRGAMTAPRSPREPVQASRYSEAMILHGPPPPPRVSPPAIEKHPDIDPPQPNIPPRTFWDWLDDTLGSK